MPEISSWDFKNQHVDENIDVNQFITASRVVIYSAVPESGSLVEYTTFNRIGLLQGFSFGEQRMIDEIFELGSDLAYIVPGRVSGNLSLSRILLTGMDLVNVLHQGDPDVNADNIIVSLKDIDAPMHLLFAAYGHSTNEGAAPAKYSRIFQGCWITSRSEQLAAGQTVLLENVTVKYEQVASYEFA